MASIIYNKCLNKALNGDIDFGADTFKAMLLTNAYTPNKDTHDFRDDLTNEVGASGSYSAGGATVSVSVTDDTANDRQDISLGAVSFTTATITARYLAYYKSRGGAASADELIALIDFGSDVSSTGGTFAVSASTLRLQN